MRVTSAGAALVVLVLGSGVARAQDISDAGLTYWNVNVDRAEYRASDAGDVFALEGSAYYGTDKLKLRYELEAEYEIDTDTFKAPKNQLVLQKPISAFFDAKAGAGYADFGVEEQFYGVVGVHGLAPQWFEVDADLKLSETGDVAFLFEAEYEALITNRLILTPSFEMEVGATDDDKTERGKGFRKIELGARLRYDLIDRLVAPYIGVHYEFLLGETASIARRNGESTDGLFAVAGVRINF